MVMSAIKPILTKAPQHKTPNHPPIAPRRGLCESESESAKPATPIPRRRGLCPLDEEARQRVTQFTGLAHSLARNHHQQKARDIPMEELRAEALYALSYAAGRFDQNRGVPFGAYATMVIRHRLSQMVGVWRRSRRNISYRFLSAEEEGQYLYEAPDPHTNEIDEQMNSNELLVLVRRHLPPRWFEMLRLYYSDGLTLQEIGEYQSVSKQRVQQLIEKAIKRARRKIPIGMDE